MSVQSQAGVRIVHSFEELVATPFVDGINAVCWPRELTGDFAEVVDACGEIDEITGLEEDDLQSLSLSDAGKVARNWLINDLRLLRDQNLEPSLDIIPAYPRDDDGGPVPVDVYGFHADSATVLADTYLCSYTVAASEGLPNDQVIRRVDIPEVRSELLRQHGGGDDEGFREFLSAHCYDLHYLPLPDAKPYGFGLGNLWRISTQCPDSPVPPCIHRAPATRAGDPPRLLLIS